MARLHTLTNSDPIPIINSPIRLFEHHRHQILFTQQCMQMMALLAEATAIIID